MAKRSYKVFVRQEVDGGLWEVLVNERDGWTGKETEVDFYFYRTRDQADERAKRIKEYYEAKGFTVWIIH